MDVMLTSRVAVHAAIHHEPRQIKCWRNDFRDVRYRTAQVKSQQERMRIKDTGWKMRVKRRM